MIELTLFDLHTNEYGQGLCYYLFAVDLERFVGRCNTLNDLSNKLCVPVFNRLCVPVKTKNLNVFNLIIGIDESRTLTKHVSSKCECKFGGSKYNSAQKWNNDNYMCECKHCQTYNENYIWDPTICICENGKYLRSIFDDSVIRYDEIINAADIVLLLVLCQQIFITKKQNIKCIAVFCIRYC